MHRDRNHGTWPELKARRHNKFDDEPLDSLNVMHGHLDGGFHDIQKLKKDKAAKQLSRVKTMFKDMAEYADKQDKQT
jgi:hypothetical protein